MTGNEISPQKPAKAPVEKLAFTAAEACEALGVKRTTLWRLECRGLIAAIPHVRHKLYSVASLKRFVEGKPA